MGSRFYMFATRPKFVASLVLLSCLGFVSNFGLTAAWAQVDPAITPGVLLIESSTNRVIENEQTNVVFSVTLQCATQGTAVVQPNNVAVDITVAAPGILPDFGPRRLFFNSCGQTQTFTMTYSGDDAQQGSQTITFTATTVTTQEGYIGLTASTSIERIDPHGIDLGDVSPATTFESDARTGRTSSFQIGLANLGNFDAPPTSTVFIRLKVDDVNEVRIFSDQFQIPNPELTVIFTLDNYDQPQTIYIQGIDDATQDISKLVGITIDTITSRDPEYGGLPAPAGEGINTFVVNVDDEAIDNPDVELPGVIITPLSVETNENGSRATVSVRLSGPPLAPNSTSGAVSIGFFTSSPTEAQLISPTTGQVVTSASLTFTNANYDIEQRISIVGIDDVFEDGDIAYRIRTSITSTNDPDYVPIDPPDIAGINRDNESAGVTVTPTIGLFTTEGGGTATFSVVLNKRPAPPTGAPDSVRVNLSLSDNTEGRLDRTSLTFTSANFNQAQLVTVTGVDDDIDDGDQDYQVLISNAFSADPDYNGKFGSSVALVNFDDEEPGITVSSTSLITSEAGATATFSVLLNSKPQDTVTVDLVVTDTTEGSISPAQLTFTTTNFNIAQTITVTGLDDQEDDGDRPFKVITQATSGDVSYDGLKGIDVNVVNLDNDSAGVTVTPLTITTTEGGPVATFTVVLNSQPSENAIISIGTNLQPFANEGTVSPSSLTFTPANFNTPQTVTITPGDENVVDGPKTYKVITGTIVNGDPSYNGVNPPDVTVTNNDNDVAGVTVTPTELTTTEGSTTNATFSVKLAAQPQSNVTVIYTVGDTTEGFVKTAGQAKNSYVRLIFTPTNYMTAQTVEVIPVDDSVRDGNIVYYITRSSLVTTDAAFAKLFAPNVRVTNVDNDAAGIKLVASGPTRTSEAGATANLYVSLTSQPTQPVTATVTSLDTTEGSVNKTTLTFTPTAGQAINGTTSGWNVPQLVTVRGVDDTVQDGDISYYVQVRTSGPDPLYTGMLPAKILLVNADDGDDSTRPTIDVLSPATSTTPVRTLTYATGSATDNKGLAKVTLNIFRNADAIGAAGYVRANGTVSSPYSAILHELTANGTTSFTLRLPALATGSYRLTATATDKAGLTATAIRTFLIDQLGPKITITAPTSASTSAARATGTVVDQGAAGLGATTATLYRYASGTTTAAFYNGSAFVAETSSVPVAIGAAGSFSLDFPALSAGRYYYQMQSLDALGNVSRSAQIVFVIPGAGPTPTPTTPPAGVPVYTVDGGFQLISIPFANADDPAATTTVDQAFTVPQMSGTTVNYRIYQYDTLAEAYLGTGGGLAGNALLKRGVGYFIQPLTGNVSPRTPATDGTRKPLAAANTTFEIVLHRKESGDPNDPNNGANLIGFPFNPALYSRALWSSARIVGPNGIEATPAEAQANGWIYADIVEFRNGSYQVVTELRPYSGYSVRAKIDNIKLRLKVP